jgi:hypothetical protein
VPAKFPWSAEIPLVDLFSEPPVLLADDGFVLRQFDGVSGLGTKLVARDFAHDV